MDKAIKASEEFVSLGQGNFDAVVKSSQIWFTGMQDLSKLFAATAKTALETTMSSVTSLSSIKSLPEAIELQSSLSRSLYESATAESTKFVDASKKLAEATLAPLTERFTLATTLFAKAA